VTRHSKTLADSLASYSRSPYPSAPLVPAEYADDTVNDSLLTNRPRASSLELPRRNKKGLTLGHSSSFIPIAPTPSSSLGRSVFSPSINEDKLRVAPLDLESRLSEAFWGAVSLEECASDDDDDDEVMVTALEYYPTSAVESQIMYADADGALWSPALPKPGVAAAVNNRIRESSSLMSPISKRLSSLTTTTTRSFGGIIRKDFTAPTPNDPLASFPSFAAAMEGITYPSRVVLE